MAAGISLPTPLFQKHTIEFDVGKKGEGKKEMAKRFPQKLLVLARESFSGSAAKKNPSKQTRSKLETAATLAQLERDQKCETETHKQSYCNWEGYYGTNKKAARRSPTKKIKFQITHHYSFCA